MPLSVTNTVHGIPFNRSGLCNRCPNTQPAPCCLGCPHFKIVRKVNTCTIYTTRGDVCTECSQGRPKPVTHQVCIDFPNHPWLNVIKQGKCSYSFKRLDETGNVSSVPLPFTTV